MDPNIWHKNISLDYLIQNMNFILAVLKPSDSNSLRWVSIICDECEFGLISEIMCPISGATPLPPTEANGPDRPLSNICVYNTYNA